MKTASILTAATLALSFAVQSHADVSNVVVRYTDLDLNTVAGDRTLYDRISHAAAVVCHLPDLGLQSLRYSAYDKPLHDACMNQAVAGAVARIRDPNFTAYVATQTPLVAASHGEVARR